MAQRAERCKCFAHRRCNTLQSCYARPVWWGAKPPYAPARSRGPSHQRGRGLGGGADPLPAPVWPSGQGALRTPGHPLSLENRRGSARASPGRGLPYPLALFQLGRASPRWAASGCPRGARQGRGAVGSPPLARPPRGTGCPRPLRGGWARWAVHGGRDCYKRHF